MTRRPAYAAGMAPGRRTPVIHPSDQPPPEAPHRPGWIPRRDLTDNGWVEPGAAAANGHRDPAGGAADPNRQPGPSPRTSPEARANPGAGAATRPPTHPAARPAWALPAALGAMAVVYPAAFWGRVVPFWSAMVVFSAFSWWAAWHPYFRTRLRPTWRLVAMGVLSGAALYGVFAAGALVVGGTPLWPQVERVVQLTRGTAPGALAALVIVFGTSPSEEVLWRGAVFARLTRRYGAGWRPVVGSAVAYALFVGLSGNLVLPLAALGCGTVWARQRQVTGSLVPGLVSHALWSLLMFLYVPGLGP